MAHPRAFPSRQILSHTASQGTALWASPPTSKTSLLHLTLWANALSPAWDGHGHVGLCTHFAGAMTEEGGQLQGHAGSPGGIPLLKGFAQEQVMELLVAHSLPSPGWALLLSPGC